MTPAQKKRLLDLLFCPFEPEGTELFALLDGAKDAQITKYLAESGLQHECLVQGQLSPEARAAAPFVVRLPSQADCERLLDRCWGNAWGVFVATPGGTSGLLRHLRSLVRPQTQDYKTFFDPAALREFLPTRDSDQLRQLFGSIQRFDMEGADVSKMMRLRLVPVPGGAPAIKTLNYAL
jgi:hypothetical protein